MDFKIKKYTITLLAFIFTGLIYSQDYIYDKVYYQGQTVNMSGEINIKKKSIIIKTQSNETVYEVVNITNSENFKQYKVIGLGEDQEIRISLNQNSKVSKKHSTHLLLEIRDNFSGKFSEMIYYLNKDYN